MYRQRNRSGTLYQVFPEDGTVDVYDFDLASFMLMKAVPFVSHYREGKEFVTTFAISKEFSFDELAAKWLNSEAARFASCQKQLRKAQIIVKR